MRLRTWIVVVLAAVPGTLAAQMPMGGHAGSVASVKPLYEMAKGWLVSSAEQMPEANYAFKPTADVRSFGQILGHVANSNYMFCSIVKGEKSPATADFEKTTAKADLTKALKESLAYCDGAYQINDMKAMEEVTMPFGNMKGSRLWALAFNMGHNMEHYGNIVTYFRLKGMVPPSSQGGM